MDRPNLLLITTDQQRFDTIAHAANCYTGDTNDAIFTPHLNYLLGSGTHFRRCYSDAPICMAARATIMTGRHGHRNDYHQNGGKTVPMTRHPTLPGVLGYAGYQTRAIGKMHFNPLRAHYGFQHMQLLPDYLREMKERGHSPMDHGLGQNEMEPGFATVHGKVFGRTSAKNQSGCSGIKAIA